MLRANNASCNVEYQGEEINVIAIPLSQGSKHQTRHSTPTRALMPSYLGTGAIGFPKHHVAQPAVATKLAVSTNRYSIEKAMAIPILHRQPAARQHSSFLGDRDHCRDVGVGYASIISTPALEKAASLRWSAFHAHWSLPLLYRVHSHQTVKTAMAPVTPKQTP